jgi:hypothetical protein
MMSGMNCSGLGCGTSLAFNTLGVQCPLAPVSRTPRRPDGTANAKVPAPVPGTPKHPDDAANVKVSEGTVNAKGVRTTKGRVGELASLLFHNASFFE